MVTINIDCYNPSTGSLLLIVLLRSWFVMKSSCWGFTHCCIDGNEIEQVKRSARPSPFLCNNYFVQLSFSNTSINKSHKLLISITFRNCQLSLLQLSLQLHANLHNIMFYFVISILSTYVIFTFDFFLFSFSWQSSNLPTYLITNLGGDSSVFYSISLMFIWANQL